ncbi:hypothetical protein [Flavobacterium oreochromis]|uniref:hypothetical protein n=1 Tax=Flavobacterium oreochromis TaxID=2906078 RepID=UPI0021645187|nr:hypothetical protein [Flavobacterium oreochromis]
MSTPISLRYFFPFSTPKAPSFARSELKTKVDFSVRGDKYILKFCSLLMYSVPIPMNK